MTVFVRAETSQSLSVDDVLIPPEDETPSRDQEWARRLSEAVRLGRITQEQAYDAWCADSWWPLPSVRRVFFGPRGFTLDVHGRRVPVVGRLTRDDRGERVVVPENRGSLRAADKALLDGVAESVGLISNIPREGRPKGGVGERACRWINAQPADVPLSETVEKAANALGWKLDSMLRRYRRWLRDQRRDQ